MEQINPSNIIYNNDNQNNTNYFQPKLNNIDGVYYSLSNDIYSAIQPNNLGDPQLIGNFFSYQKWKVYSSLENNQWLSPRPKPNI